MPRNSTAEGVKATPMMEQYWAIKRDHPDALLFYRMGDFYEMFFDDAIAAAATLDIALTKRSQHLGNDIPMCGVPTHSHERHLETLIAKGHRVAICEQMENPAEAKKRGPKAVVKRAVVRVVTPGTITEDVLLDPRRHNFLAALAEAGGGLGLAWLDVSTGDTWLQTLAVPQVAAALARVSPGELLASERLAQTPDLFEAFGELGERLTSLPATRFDSVNAGRRLKELYGVAALDAFGAPGRAEIAALGALVDYVELTQVGRLPRLAPPRRMPPPGESGAALEIDAATRRNLELTRTLGGERRGSLLDTIDRTVTGAGARLLAQHLTAPLTDIAAIERRLDMVATFVDDARLREDLRAALKAAPDIERALSRLSIGRGGPRDLAATRDGLRAAAAVRDRLGGTTLGLPEGITAAATDLGEHGVLVDRLARALTDDLPLLARDGGFVAEGYVGELDEQRTLARQSRTVIAGLQTKYAELTGVPSLKIKHNNVLGYFVEVTATHGGKLSGNPGEAGGLPFVHRQTMANAMRFTTVELGELQDKIARAADRAVAIELALFQDLVGEVLGHADAIASAAAALAALDVATAQAMLVMARDYTRPEITDGITFAITAGRHPVVEAALADAPFVANNCDLSPAQRLWLVTGPNMAGKSTFLRQNALIAILAQAGGFVPARTARIGVVDRLFSRVGAADDLARGRSTFMVEMVETATILNQATERSLVILDEIGRGTATFDGLSIAWATIEHLHDTNRCRTLFATHYHELTSLAARLEHLACHTMRVKEWQGDVVFLHEVAPGAADRSYGIHVARLAGLPAAIVERAEAILQLLEAGEQGSALTRLADDLPLFAATPAPKPEPSAVETGLAAVNPDELTPKQALELLYRLRALLDA